MRSAVVVALVAALGALAAPAAPAFAADRQSALRLLNSLPVSGEHPQGYARDLFADWLARTGDGCDTRQEVLIVERVSGRVADCTVTAGTWLSSYDGAVVHSPTALQIDHRVPLEEAWASGAWRWTQATRDRYSNDLGYSASLLAVTVHENESKGAQEPSEWMPALSSQRCSYIRSWIGVKYRWRLSVDAAEKSYLARQLRGCNPMMAVPRRAVVHTA